MSHLTDVEASCLLKYSYHVPLSIPNHHTVRIQSLCSPCVETLVDNPSGTVSDSQQLSTMYTGDLICLPQSSLQIPTAPADIRLWPHERPQVKNLPAEVNQFRDPWENSFFFFKPLNYGVFVLQPEITGIIYYSEAQAGWSLHFYLSI